jgi:2-polyprenyl-3-methyl-5-hydroxy-6-metoxy-1,4-benzoquinol methylase
MPVNNAGVTCRSVQNCELCASPGEALYTDLFDRLFGAPGRWNIFQCVNSSCRLLWCNPRPDPDEIGKLYLSYYTHSIPEEHREDARQSLKSFLKKILATIFFWRAPAFLTDNLHLQSFEPGNLLEIGCGNGKFLLSASAAGWKVQGIDFDEKAINAAKSRLGSSVRQGELIACRFEQEQFDAIVMSNVIEHVWNPIETLNECWRLLRRGGRLIMVTPNSDSDGHRLFRKEWRGLEPPRHLFIYNKRSLNRLAKITGFAGSLIFSSTGGSTGVSMLGASAPDGFSSSRLKRIIQIESVKTIFGLMSGEWVVSIFSK